MKKIDSEKQNHLHEKLTNYLGVEVKLTIQPLWRKAKTGQEVEILKSVQPTQGDIFIKIILDECFLDANNFIIGAVCDYIKFKDDASYQIIEKFVKQKYEIK